MDHVADSTLGFTVMNAGPSSIEGEILESCGAYEITHGAGAYELSGGESHEVTVRFSPLSCGAEECFVETGSAGCPSVQCAGGGGGSACSVSTAILDFGDLHVGESSDLAFTIANVGCAALNGAVTESCGDYSVIGGGAYLIDPGEAQDFTVRFSPSSCGQSECALDTGHGACAGVVCSGAGAGSACDVRPGTLTFGEVGKGYERSKSFRIFNQGCVRLEGYLSEDCPAFTIESVPSWSLSPEESTEVSVKFAPLSCDDSGICRIDTGNPLAGSVDCTATVGCGCWVSDEDMFHDFGCLEDDQSRNKAFYIKNLGTDTLRIDIRIKPGCSGGLWVNLGGGYQTIAPNEEHQVVVRFSPGEEPSYECKLDLGACGEIELVGARCDGGDLPLPTAAAKCFR